MAKVSEDQLRLSVATDHQRTESRRVMQQVRADAERIATRFGLRYKSIRAERPETTEHYGVCYADGAIRIRLRHATTGRLLRYSSLMDTLCHELAHTRHFDHGERFQLLFEDMLQWCRTEGIYQPQAPSRRAAEAEPEPPPTSERQLPLFGGVRLRQVVAGKK